MFNVLVFLYENYWQPNVPLDFSRLTNQLTSWGFEGDEVQKIVTWFENLTDAALSYQDTQNRQSMRIFTPAEQDHFDPECLGFLSFLESAGVLSASMREMVMDCAATIDQPPVTLKDLKIIVLMVFWSLGKEPDVLILDELFVNASERSIH